MIACAATHAIGDIMRMSGGMVFLVAAVQKARTPLGAELWRVLGFPGLAEDGVGNWMVVSAEIGLAAWLIVGVAPAYALSAQVIVLLLFSVVLVRLKSSDGNPDCGCFGPATTDPDHALGLLRNLGLMGWAGIAGMTLGRPCGERGQFGWLLQCLLAVTVTATLLVAAKGIEVVLRFRRN